MVPELHEDGINYHFHGIVQGDLKLTWAKFDRKKQIDIYNLDGWPYGWSTATAIKDKKRVSTYIAKYLTKKLTVPAGAKSYWASRGLQRPSLEYVEMDEIEFRWSILENARYTKEIVCEYGHYFIAEE